MMASEQDSTKAQEDICSKLDDAQKAIIVLKETIDEKATQLEKDKSEFISMTKKLDVHFKKHIKLNIGGAIFKTSLDTLCKDPDSMFASMFSKRFDIKEDEDDGAYFIDRDGTHFRYILNFLRTGELVFPKDNALLKRELILEAEFYNLKGMKSELFLQGFEFVKTDIINSLTRTQKVALASFVPTPIHHQWVMLYSQKQGWSPSNFHSSCDNKGPTVVVAKTDSWIWGGYSGQPWTSNRNFVNDSSAFLFSLANYSGAEPTMMSQINNAAGIWCNEDYGPIFGTASGVSIHFMAPNNGQNCTIVDNDKGFQCPLGQDLSAFLFNTTAVQMTSLEIFGLEKC